MACLSEAMGASSGLSVGRQQGHGWCSGLTEWEGVQIGGLSMEEPTATGLVVPGVRLDGASKPPHCTGCHGKRQPARSHSPTCRQSHFLLVASGHSVLETVGTWRSLSYQAAGHCSVLARAPQ